MGNLRDHFGLFPVIAVRAHIPLFASLCAGGVVCCDPLVGMGALTDTLGFRIGTFGTFAFLPAGSGTGRADLCSPAAHGMSNFWDGFCFAYSLAVRAGILFFTCFSAGGIVGSDPPVCMSCNVDALGFLLGACGALAYFLAGGNTGGVDRSGPASP